MADKGKLNFEFAAQNTSICTCNDLIVFLYGLPSEFNISKFGWYDSVRDMDNYDDDSLDIINGVFEREPTGSLNLRLSKFTLNYFWGDEKVCIPSSIILFSRAQKLESKISAIDVAWDRFFPDGQAFYHCLTGYIAKASDPRFGQDEAEDVNRLSLLLQYPLYSAKTGLFSCNAGRHAAPLDYLDLLPGLMWRIGMGEHHFEKYNVSPEEISKVCVSTEETTAANGDKVWKFQSREDPLDWRESYERQLKLDRPDVFFDIAPLRERFAEPVDIKDSGQGDELDTVFKKALIELYPASATKGIDV